MFLGVKNESLRQSLGQLFGGVEANSVTWSTHAIQCFRYHDIQEASSGRQDV